MELDDRQLEQVARRLDGEEVPLDERQEKAAQAVRAEEARLADLLDAPPPRRTLARVEARVTAELRRPRRRVLRLAAGGAGVAAAAAAAVLVATFTTEPPSTTVPPTVARNEPVPLAVALEASEASVEVPEMALLETEVGELRSELAASEAAVPEMDAELDYLQQRVEEFWLGEAEPEPLEL
jgi:hypothetical protein